MVFSGVLPTAPETVEQHTVLYRIIRLSKPLPQPTQQPTRRTNPKMWTFATTGHRTTPGNPKNVDFRNQSPQNGDLVIPKCGLLQPFGPETA